MNYSIVIKNIRDLKLLTQEELAQELGVNSITICRWETCKCEPAIKAKKIIRDYCIKNSLDLLSK